MGEELHLDFRYEEDAVVSAQRMRLTHSTRFKLLAAAGTIATIGSTAWQAYMVWFANSSLPSGWYTPVGFSAVFVGVFAVAFFAPRLDFRSNVEWKPEYCLRLFHDHLCVTLKGKDDGFRMDYDLIKKVLETETAYILFWGSGDDNFVIIPKGAFREPSTESSFRDRLKRQAITSG